MASFEELGLRESLLGALEEENLEHPTAIQREIVPVVRRGGNLVARAGSGSGKTLGYALGVLDRLEPRDDTAELEDDAEPYGARALLLRPTREAAARTALALFPYVQAAGLTLAVPGGAWGTPPEQADVLVATPADAMEAVGGSALKMENVEAVVVDGASSIEELGQWDAIDTLLDHLPRDAQRVVVTSAMSPEIDDLIDRRVKRALRYPAEPAVPESGDAAPPEGRLGFTFATEREKLELLARLLVRADEGQPAPLVHFRSAERAARVAEELSMRGFLIGEPGEAGADVVIVMGDDVSREQLAAETGAALGRGISYDVPADAELLRARHAGDASALLLVEPRELPHLREVARRAGLGVRPVAPPSADNRALAGLDAFRQELRRALDEEDLAAQMLVLEPLFDEFSAAEIAAAATALLRSKRAAAPAAVAGPAAPARSATGQAAGGSRPASAEPGAAPAAWARLFISIGSRDGARPGDLVGAIAGEANIPGGKVGKIDIRDTFSVVEVQSDVADQVIRSLNGTTVKGRSVRADYDRGGDRGGDRARRPARGPGAPRTGGPGGPGGSGRRIVRRPTPREE
jgi:ATP-dependent RNA helicase DeaD